MRSSTSSFSADDAPLPLRSIPHGSWPRTLLIGVILFLVGLAGWEAYWRSEWHRPAARNSDGLWAMTRDRIEAERGRGVVIVGSSRVLFDINLYAWQQEAGVLPIQLALEGTNPRPFLTHVAQETDFAGLVVVGVTELLFFNPAPGLRAVALQRYRERSPADQVSHQISMRVVEPVLASYDPDTALFTVMRRQPLWPRREGLIPSFPEVRKLSVSDRARHTQMWERVELDPEYLEIARATWLTGLNTPPPPMPPPEEMAKLMDAMYEQVAGDVRTIRARGGDVIFVRCPSIGPFRQFEMKVFPRSQTWDVLLQRADAAGIYFEDYPDLQDVEIPEWSHISSGDAPRFTRALIGHMREAMRARGTPRPELGQ